MSKENLKVTIDRIGNRVVLNDLEKIEKVNINGSDYLVFTNCDIAEINNNDLKLEVLNNLRELALNADDERVKLQANVKILNMYMNS